MYFETGIFSVIISLKSSRLLVARIQAAWKISNTNSSQYKSAVIFHFEDIKKNVLIRRKLLPESWSVWSICIFTWFLAQIVKNEFQFSGKAVFRFFTPRNRKNIVRIVISAVNLPTHVILSSICKSRVSTFWGSSSPFYTSRKKEISQNRNQRDRFAYSRDF